MSKRMTDTDKWKKPFIKSLKPQFKLFWLYLLDDCNLAGIWEVEQDIAELRIGMAIDFEEAKKAFSDKIIVFDEGKKWILKDFVKFQNGETLSDKSPVHRKIIDMLKSYKVNSNTLYDTLFDRVFQYPISNSNSNSNSIGNSSKEEVQEKPKNIEQEIIEEVLNSQSWLNDTCKHYRVNIVEGEKLLTEFLAEQKLKDEIIGREIKEIKSHFISWLKLNLKAKENKFPIIPPIPQPQRYRSPA